MSGMVARPSRMRTLLAFPSIALALVLACSSSGGGSGNVPLNGNCNQDSDCAPVAGQQIQCLCSPTGTDTNAQCIALLQAGASCESTSPFQTPCASGLYCGVNPGGLNTAVCVAYAEGGQSCATASCDVGLACQPGTQICGAQFAIGVACTTDNDCAGTAVCSTSFVCAAPAAIGQACFGFTPAPGDTSGEKNPCVAGANCVNSTCVTAVANGGACTDSTQCASGICDVTSSGAGTCGAAPSDSGGVQLCFR
jgi:hypothetical protein